MKIKKYSNKRQSKFNLLSITDEDILKESLKHTNIKSVKIFNSQITIETVSNQFWVCMITERSLFLRHQNEHKKLHTHKQRQWCDFYHMFKYIDDHELFESQGRSLHPMSISELHPIYHAY